MLTSLEDIADRAERIDVCDSDSLRQAARELRDEDRRPHDLETDGPSVSQAAGRAATALEDLAGCLDAVAVTPCCAAGTRVGTVAQDPAAFLTRHVIRPLRRGKVPDSEAIVRGVVGHPGAADWAAVALLDDEPYDGPERLAGGLTVEALHVAAMTARVTARLPADELVATVRDLCQDDVPVAVIAVRTPAAAELFDRLASDPGTTAAGRVLQHTGPAGPPFDTLADTNVLGISAQDLDLLLAAAHLRTTDPTHRRVHSIRPSPWV